MAQRKKKKLKSKRQMSSKIREMKRRMQITLTLRRIILQKGKVKNKAEKIRRVKIASSFLESRSRRNL